MPDEESKKSLSGGLDKLDRQLQELSKEIKSEKKKKDIWDKISAVSTLASGVVVALVVLYFTLTFNERQSQRNSDLKVQENRIAELQALEKFIPYLTGSEESKKFAILTLSSLGYSEFVSKFAELDQGQGAISALSTIAAVSPEEEKKRASQSIEAIFAKIRSAVVAIVIKSKGSIRDMSSGILVNPNGYILTTFHGLLEDIGSQSITVTTLDGKDYRAKLFSSDSLNDLAVLKIEGVGFSTLPFSQRPLELDEQIFVILGSAGTFPSPLASGTVEYFDDRRRTIFIKADRDMFGSSGGAVISTRGSVVGIIKMLKVPSVVTAKGKVTGPLLSQAIACVGSDVATAYLESLGITFFLERTTGEFKPIYFEVGSAFLDQHAKTILDDCARVLQKYPHISVTVTGYRDDVPLSWDEEEQPFKRKELPRERTIAIKDYLLERGISVERISIQSLAIKCPEGSQGEKGCCIIRTH